MQIAASNPRHVSRQDVDDETIAKERYILEEQAKAAGRPDHIIPKIVDGRIEKFFEEVCLLDQPFVKNQDLTVDELIKEHIAKVGENITVGRFTRFVLGETP
jgi:elongation factor Ts